MDYYTLAIWLGRTALLLVVLAPLHYFLRLLFIRLQKQSPAAGQWLRGAVTFTRGTHQYLGLLVAATPLYHMYVMWSTHPFGLKVGLGMATATALYFMVITGWRLKSQPAELQLRNLHRPGFVVLWLLLAAHRLA
jgi:hypothetical protein